MRKISRISRISIEFVICPAWNDWWHSARIFDVAYFYRHTFVLKWSLEIEFCCSIDATGSCRCNVCPLKFLTSSSKNIKNCCFSFRLGLVELSVVLLGKHVIICIGNFCLKFYFSILHILLIATQCRLVFFATYTLSGQISFLERERLIIMLISVFVKMPNGVSVLTHFILHCNRKRDDQYFTQIKSASTFQFANKPTVYFSLLFKLYSASNGNEYSVSI